jgi:DNA-binding MarR family transcriptional regulator
MRLDKSTMSRVVRTLVRKGYAKPAGDPRDGRVVMIAITHAGRKLYERIEAELIAQQEAVLHGLDPHLRGEVAEVISRLARAAEARFITGRSVGCADGSCAC